MQEIIALIRDMKSQSAVSFFFLPYMKYLICLENRKCLLPAGNPELLATTGLFRSRPGYFTDRSAIIIGFWFQKLKIISFSENQSTDPHNCTPLPDSDPVISRHPHGNFPEIIFF